MKIPQPIEYGMLIKRYKRFLADIKLDNGKFIIAHCPNSGSLKSCNIPGNKVVVSTNDNPARKLRYTWEQIQVADHWVGINTQYPNKLVWEGIKSGTIKELQNYTNFKPEVKIGNGNRIDLRLDGPQGRCYIEVKNVTFVENNRAMFPDAVTKRGQKHLIELSKISQSRQRAVLFFVVQREDGQSVTPADGIDPEFGKILRQVVLEGVEAIAYQASVTPKEILITNRVPVIL